MTTAAVAGVLMISISACSQATAGHSVSKSRHRITAARQTVSKASVAPQFADPLPGMPPVIHENVYAATRAGMIDPRIAREPALLYVPDSSGSSVTVISQASHKIVEVIPTGFLNQHVVPAYNLSTLYVNTSAANMLVPLNPRTVRRRASIHVPRPYNLYFTPDGKQSVVMVEQHDIIRFSDPRTFKEVAKVSSPGCKGPNHADFSANGQFFVVTCEFSGELLKVSTSQHRILGAIKLRSKATASGASPDTMGTSMPQDVRLSPDGRTFYVADMGTNELILVDTLTFKVRSVIGMPSRPHGLYPSRNGKYLYISDRGAGKISVLAFATNKIVATWVVPGGGSFDMGGVSANGKILWLSGRYDGVVYGINTRTGKLIARIYVGGSPHGLAVWPQPGRYSLGHTGNMR